MLNIEKAASVAPVVEREVPRATSSPRQLVGRWLASDHLALIGFLVVLGAVFTVKSPYFLTYDNFLNILAATVTAGIIAVPATMLLVSAQIDLSVGSGVAVCGVVMARVAEHHPIGIAVLAVFGLGALIGMVNGFFVTVVRVNPLITTLGSMAILSGAAELASGGQTVQLKGFTSLGRARPFASIPLSVLLLLAVLVIGALLLRYTVFGRQLYSIGGNPVAARLVGIRANRLVFVLFVASGLAVSVSALIQTSQLGAGSAISATGLELSVVTAVVLGGTSLSGGRGTIVGTVLGLLIIGTLNDGLILLNVDPFWQDVARGTLLIGAVSFDQVRVRLAGVRRVRRLERRATDAAPTVGATT